MSIRLEGIGVGRSGGLGKTPENFTEIPRTPTVL